MQRFPELEMRAMGDCSLSIVIHFLKLDVAGSIPVSRSLPVTYDELQDLSSSDTFCKTVKALSRSHQSAHVMDLSKFGPDLWVPEY
jgi:hypothetical protein